MELLQLISMLTTDGLDWWLMKMVTLICNPNLKSCLF